MSESDLGRMITKLGSDLENYDVLHIQHEFALYGHNSFQRIVQAAKQAGKKVVLTVHTSPGLASKPVRLKGIGPRSIMKYLREQRHRRHFLDAHIEPFKAADLVLAHNDLTIQSLKEFGVSTDRIRKIAHPVYAFDPPPKSDKVATNLHKKSGDIIYCSTGFIHQYKGMTEAVKALKFLPENYKLAILGGMKSDSDDVAFYDKLCDLIDTLGLQDRVYITGYVQDDDELNALIAECDVCVFPYDRVYYSSVSSGPMNLAFAQGKPVIAYPTAAIKETAVQADGAVVLTNTFAYYELARELKAIDLKKQVELSKAYAEKMAWPKVSKELVSLYEAVVKK
jgi:glycosyltransferase involved in cell wall biosynthesis